MVKQCKCVEQTIRVKFVKGSVNPSMVYSATVCLKIDRSSPHTHTECISSCIHSHHESEQISSWKNSVTLLNLFSVEFIVDGICFVLIYKIHILFLFTAMVLINWFVVWNNCVVNLVWRFIKVYSYAYVYKLHEYTVLCILFTYF